MFRRQHPWTATVGLHLLALGLSACGEGGSAPPAAGGDSVEPRGSFNARPELIEQFRADLAAPRHPGDGAGRARLVLAPGDDGSARVGEPRSWKIEFIAGPEGVAVGGAVFLLVSPFWGWSSPQVHDPRAFGYTEVTTDAQGVALEPRAHPPSLLEVRVGGRPLGEGDRVIFDYGAGVGALPDRHAGRESRLWIAVDADGDGVRAVIPDSPAVDVLPGPAAQLVATLESTVEPGRDARLTVAVLDATASAGCPIAGEVLLRSVPPGWDPPPIRLDPPDAGRRTVLVTPPGAGTWRLVASIEVEGRQLRCLSNPLRVEPGVEKVLWADLHGHSGLSDGTGTPEDYFAYARDVAALDVCALTDHDHYGIRALDRSPDLWARIRAAVEAAHEPGRFVALLAYEWTNWRYGHRHVLWFERDGVVLSSLDERTDAPDELWRALAGRDALTIAHHSAGEPVAIDWSFAPDPRLEPVTEIMSVHGSSEAEDCPMPVRGARRGNYARDALDRGYRLGFVGSGDSHDGHPGLPHRDGAYGYRPPVPGGDPLPRLGTGGLAAIYAPERTRTAVLAALRARRAYATSGPRMLLAVRLGPARGGETLAAQALGENPSLELRLSAAGILERIELVRSGEVVEVLDPPDPLDLEHSFPLPDLAGGEYVYVRVRQANGGLGWSSPIWIEP